MHITFIVCNNNVQFGKDEAISEQLELPDASYDHVWK